LATNAPAAANGDGATRQRIIAAARQCFTRYGPRRTTMEDVAAAAGIARPALYRYVSSRDAIIEAVIIERVEELAEEIRAQMDPSMSFAEAMVEVSLASINLARHDPELQALFQTTTGTRIIEVMAGLNNGFHDFVKAFFEQIFAAARAAGDLRSDVSDDQLVEWIRGVYMMMILREDLDAEREREMIETFLLPSLLPRHDDAVDLTERRGVAAAPAAKRRRSTKTGR